MKTAIFIDGSNIYASAKALSYDVDYSRLLPAFNADDSLIRAFYYSATLQEADGTVLIRPLLDWLEYNGYDVVQKPCKVFKDEATGMTKVKGNMDMEIAVDCMRMAEHVSHIILFSGDGDFKYLVKAVQQKGVRVTVVSTLCSRHNRSPMIADELRRAADIFIDMDDPRVKAKIARRNGDAQAG